MSGSTSGFGMAGVNQVAGFIGGAFTDLAAAQAGRTTASGELAAAAGFGQATQEAYSNEQQTEAAGKLQLIQQQRQLYQVGGTAQAQTAGQGLKLEGSAASILRNTAAQGAVAQQLTSTQTAINAAGYMAQMQSDTQEQMQAMEAEKAAKGAASSGLIGGLIKGVTAVAGAVAMFYTGGAAAPLVAGALTAENAATTR